MNEELQNELFELAQEELKDFWKEEDKDFLLQLAKDVAREKIAMGNSENPGEHQQNLKHLAVTLRGEIARKRLKIRKDSVEIFIKVLVAVIKTVAFSSLKIKV